MTKMNIDNQKILTTSILATIMLASTFTFIAPQVQSAYAVDFPSVGDISNAVKNALEPLFDIIEDLLDDVVNNAEHGLSAIDDEVQRNIDSLENVDFGLEALDDLLEDAEHGLKAQVDDAEYGLKRIADDTQDEVFGLEAQVEDAIYGLKRIADDSQNDDFGLEAIDDEVEFMGEKTLQQLSKQEVDISVKKSNNLTYLKTSESGKSVDVEFLKVQLISGTDMTDLVPSDVITKIAGATGLYLLDVGKVGNVDSIFVEVQHLEPPVIHPKLSPGGTDVDHFGSTLITPQGTSK